MALEDLNIKELSLSPTMEALSENVDQSKSSSIRNVIVDGGSSSEVAYDADESSLPPVDKGRHAWTFCMSACVFETFIWGWNNTYGIFQDYYSSNPPFNKSSAASISIIGTASLGIQYIEVVFLIAFFQRYPEYSKVVMWSCLLVCVLSLVVSSFATQLWHLIVLQGVIFGLSAGALYAPMIMWLSDWFVDRRGLAGGIIFGGAGVGGFIFPLAMGYLLKGVGFRWTLSSDRIWAITLGVCCGVALLGVNPRARAKKPTKEMPRHPWFPKDLKLLRRPLLFWIVGTTGVQALAYFPISVFIPTYTSFLSVATISSAVSLALFNATSVVFYIIFGRLCDSYPYPYVIMASGIGSSLAAFLLWGFASSLSLVFVFSAIFGGLGGGFPGIWPAAASEIGGSANHITSLAFGCFAVAKGIAAIVGPIIAASLHDAKDPAKLIYGSFGFRNVQIYVGTMAAATGVGGVILRFYSTSRKTKNACE